MCTCMCALSIRLKHTPVVPLQHLQTPMPLGAYAIENARTGLEAGASSMTVLGRRRGSICPQLVDWLNWIRPRDEMMKRSARGDTIVFSAWQLAYRESGAVQPDVWAQGHLTPPGLSISVSDIFYVAHRLNIMSVRLGSVARLEEKRVITKDEYVITAQILIKSIGFVWGTNTEELLGRARMAGIGRVEHNLWVIFEGQFIFPTPFGSSHLAFAQYFAKLALRSWRRPEVAAAISGINLPCGRMNWVLLGEKMGLQELIEADITGDSKKQLYEQGKQIASDANQMFTLQQYITQNRAQWEAYRSLFLPVVSAVIRSPKKWVYPFVRALGELADEGEQFQLVDDDITLEGRSLQAVGERSVSTSVPFEPDGTSPLVESVLETVQQSTAYTELDADTPISEAGLDSLAAAAIANALQERFDIELPATLLYDFLTARQLTAALIDIQVATPGGELCGESVQVPAEASEVIKTDVNEGWVISLRLSTLLAGQYPLAWWSAGPMKASQAGAMFLQHSSLRTSFTQDTMTGRWQWAIKSSSEFPVRTSSSQALDFEDRSTPFFFDALTGLIWMSHTCWDAFSFAVLAKGATASRHFSVQEERVHGLHLCWKEGNRIVDEVLRAPGLFENADPYIFCRKRCHLPQHVHQTVHHCSKVHKVSLADAWYAMVMVKILECKQMSLAR